MAEPRMRLRQKGQQFPTSDLEAFLIAFGDDDNPLPETVKVLDEIITDFIIETSHEAAQCAHYSRRAKIKVDDYKFMLRRDSAKLGRVSELLDLDKDLKNKRKAFNTDEGAVVKDTAGEKGGKEKDKGGKGEEKGGRGDKAEEDGERGEGEERRKKKKRRKERGGGGDDAGTVTSF
ncbi:TFIID-18kDa-domain-containing protein [Delitschia confertaspora ATCC 74209]|uniref:Transcription initiation factor TFIID subunit 13 n=1 Tax=Delitschia confertaspora ATCC 74209 TaxID=1513339 RepID=A0A9P4N023_9PLEO|nr:TFIID-18kDa-domain-containing protein [Delitschia confertaspora ATCC 74209]